MKTVTKTKKYCRGITRRSKEKFTNNQQQSENVAREFSLQTFRIREGTKLIKNSNALSFPIVRTIGDFDFNLLFQFVSVGLIS